MSQYFSGKRVFVTGGSSGIGHATARLLAARGAHVVICGRDQARLDAAIATLAAAPTRRPVSGIALDVSDAETIPRAAEEAARRLGGIDIVINNAGITQPGHFLELSPKVFDDILATNFLGAVNVTRAFLPYLMRSPSAHVSFVSSVAGFLGVFGYTAYAGSKFALTGFAECLRQELKPKGIGVSVLFPPDTDTPQLAGEEPLKPAETRAIAGTIRPVSAELVARQYLNGIAAGRKHIHPGFETRVLSVVQRLAPWAVRRYMDGQVRRAARQAVR